MLERRHTPTVNDNASDHELEELILEADHPGINDPEYVARRKYFFDVARASRLKDEDLPQIEYSEEEHQIWQNVMTRLDDAHNRYGCDFYLQGKKELNLQADRIPSLVELDQRLRKQHGIRLIAAEGLIDTRHFFSYLSKRIMPCTLYLRYGENPQYTPEPDTVHDVVGHVPPLMNKEYVELIQLIGKAVAKIDDTQLLAWQRIYWFTIEFGLIEEKDTLKAMGAGLLSSFGELEYCFSDNVIRKPLDIEEIINTDYDPTRMQDILFVIPSLGELHKAVGNFIKRNALFI